MVSQLTFFFVALLIKICSDDSNCIVGSVIHKRTASVVTLHLLVILLLVIERSVIYQCSYIFKVYKPQEYCDLNCDLTSISDLLYYFVCPATCEQRHQMHQTPAGIEPMIMVIMVITTMTCRNRYYSQVSYECLCECEFVCLEFPLFHLYFS